MTTLNDGRVSVPMNIEGQTVDMLVDTGGVFSMVAPSVAEALHYEPRPIPYRRITMYGGIEITHYIMADYALGGIVRKNFQFPVLPNGDRPSGANGFLASDIMEGFGVEFDFANPEFSMFQQDGCEGPLTYWTHDPYERIEFTLSDSGHITVPAVLDGKEVQADVDTGSPVSVARLEQIEEDFGIGENDPAMHLVPGASSERPLYRYPFKRLSLRNIAIDDPNIILVPESRSKIPSGLKELVLGMDVLRRFHLYIDYGKRVLYATPATAH